MHANAPHRLSLCRRTSRPREACSVTQMLAGWPACAAGCLRPAKQMWGHGPLGTRGPRTACHSVALCHISGLILLHTCKRNNHTIHFFYVTTLPIQVSGSGGHRVPSPMCEVTCRHVWAVPTHQYVVCYILFILHGSLLLFHKQHRGVVIVIIVICV